MTTTRIALLVLIACLIVAFWVFNLDRYLTLAHAKASMESLKAFHEGHPALVVAGYFALYVVFAALSLPGAVVLTVAGGSLLGLAAGTIVVSFASSLGATIACLVSRYILRTWVQNKLGRRIDRLNDGIKKEGAFYLFSLRLIPVFPFWMINLAMGLTRMPLRTFYWVSQLGMLPGTLVYVNAGRELAQIESVRGILSPGLIISFALIGILPIATKKSLVLYRKRNKKPT
jgi:uncharacterized membrane protein YdjX (TVP38/TMEM64 family)